MQSDRPGCMLITILLRSEASEPRGALSQQDTARGTLSPVTGAHGETTPALDRLPRMIVHMVLLILPDAQGMRTDACP